MFITQLFLHQVREALRARKARRRKQSDQKTGTTPASNSNPMTPTADKNSRIDKFVFSGKEESVRKKNKTKIKEREKIKREIIREIS